MPGDRIPETKRPSVGLVLGAGGVVGQAYQAGVLAALEREAHFDARDADIIVGTSAGSVTGAALRVGVPATDLAASTYGRPTSAQGGALLKRIITDESPLPVAVPPLAPAALESALARPHQAHGPASAGFPARRGHDDAPPPGPDRHQCAGPTPCTN